MAAACLLISAFSPSWPFTSFFRRRWAFLLNCIILLQQLSLWWNLYIRSTHLIVIYCWCLVLCYHLINNVKVSLLCLGDHCPLLYMLVINLHLNSLSVSPPLCRLIWLSLRLGSVERMTAPISSGITALFSLENQSFYCLALVCFVVACLILSLCRIILVWSPFVWLS